MRALALDLANTLLRGTGGTERDGLVTPADLERWLREHEADLGPTDPSVALRLPEFRELRGRVLELLAAVAEGRRLPPAAVEAVNAAAAAAPSVLRLEVDGRVVDQAAAGSPTARILGEVARSAIRLVGEGVRLGRCARCGRLFPAGRAGRRWCSPACGNRERVARHRARHRAARSVG